MGTEKNIEQGLRNVNAAFKAWGFEVYSSGQQGVSSEYAQLIDGGDAASIELHFLTNTPVMREWTGARQYKVLRHYSTTILPKRYEATIKLSKRVVDRDPAGVVASIMPQFTSQVDGPDAALASAYDASSGAGPTGFDAVALFSASHPHSSSGSTQSNLGSGTNLSHVNLVAAEYGGSLITQENTRPAKIVYDTMRVGPKLKRRAMELLGPVRIAGLSTADAEGGTSASHVARPNTFQGDMRLVVDDRVTTFYWDLIDTSKGPIRPMALFMVKPPTLVERTDPADPHVFEHNEYIYGADGEWGIGAGHWYTCYRGTGTA